MLLKPRQSFRITLYFSNLNLKTDYPDSVSLAVLQILVQFQGMFILKSGPGRFQSI